MAAFILWRCLIHCISTTGAFLHRALTVLRSQSFNSPDGTHKRLASRAGSADRFPRHIHGHRRNSAQGASLL
jgi:hypothetical protein